MTHEKWDNGYFFGKRYTSAANKKDGGRRIIPDTYKTNLQKNLSLCYAYITE